MTLIQGKTSSGEWRPIKVSEDGTVQTSGGGGSGGGGDASAENQLAEIDALSTISANVSDIETKLNSNIAVTDGGGSLTVDGIITISNFPATQAISAPSLPLPTGASTEATLSALNTAAGAQADSAATNSTSSWSILALLKGLYAKLAGTLAVSASSLPLPSGAATSAKQDTQTTSIDTIGNRLPASLGAKTSANSFPVTLSTDGAFSTNFGVQADSVATDSSGNWSAIALLKNLGNFGALADTASATGSLLGRMRAIANSASSILAAIPTQLNTDWTAYSNLGSSNAASVKASSGRVMAITIYNTNSSTRFFQLHNKASAPSNGEAPVLSLPVFANSLLIIDKTFFGETGRVFSTGIAFGFSSTANTFTAATASDQTTFINYI